MLKVEIEELRLSIKGHDMVILDWEKRYAMKEEEIVVWMRKYGDLETKIATLRALELKIEEYELSIRGHDAIILDWQSRYGLLEQSIIEWERKHGNLLITIDELRVWEGKYRHLEEEVRFLREEIRRWEKKCIELEDYIAKDKIHDLEVNEGWEGEMWKLKEYIFRLREELKRIQAVSHARITDLTNRLKTFCRVWKESRMLMEKFENLCHVEDIMREKIEMVESVTYMDSRPMIRGGVTVTETMDVRPSRLTGTTYTESISSRPVGTGYKGTTYTESISSRPVGTGLTGTSTTITGSRVETPMPGFTSITAKEMGHMPNTEFAPGTVVTNYGSRTGGTTMTTSISERPTSNYRTGGITTSVTETVNRVPSKRYGTTSTTEVSERRVYR